MSSARRGPVTADELVKRLEHRYRTDPEYRASVDQHEAQRWAREEELSRAEAPVVADLRNAGIPVHSTWELDKHPEAGEAAYPLLLKHLALDYPDDILDTIARAFSKDVARRHWRELLRVYLAETRPAAQDGLAATLSGCAVRAHFEELLAILDDDALGETRIYFLRPVNRIGNRLQTGAGRKVVERFANDPQLGTEATAILRGRGRSD